MGCPIDVVCNKGCGAQLATRHTKVQGIVRTMSAPRMHRRATLAAAEPAAHGHLRPPTATYGCPRLPTAAYGP